MSLISEGTTAENHYSGYFNSVLVRKSGNDEIVEEDENEYVIEDNDGGYDGGYNSFDRMEAAEAEKTMALLLQSDFKIFESQFNYKEEMQKTLRRQDQEGKKNLMYYSEGYEANVDQADDLEISRWQHFFPYIQIVGEGYEEPRGLISRQLPVVEDRNGEEEVFAEHNSKPLEGVKDHRIEEIARAVWPHVANTLEPIVRGTLTYAEENKVPKQFESFLAFSNTKMELEQADKDDFWD